MFAAPRLEDVEQGGGGLFQPVAAYVIGKEKEGLAAVPLVRREGGQVASGDVSSLVRSELAKMIFGPELHAFAHRSGFFWRAKPAHLGDVIGFPGALQINRDAAAGERRRQRG